MRLTILLLLAATLFPLTGIAQTPVFEVDKSASKITFYVKSSVDLTGVFDEWDASLVFTSTDVKSGKLNVKISAASVDAGSGFKNDKLKGKDFFDVKNNPYITFDSTKFVPVNPNEVQVEGNFTIRGVTKPQTMTFTGERQTGGGTAQGKMAFDRRDFDMNHNIPFIKIADLVQVEAVLHVRRVSGPPVVIQ